MVITSILIKGIKSSGKASYVLAIFPYMVLFILLIRSLTLPGAFNGVLYFLKPQWNKLLDPQVILKNTLMNKPNLYFFINLLFLGFVLIGVVCRHYASFFFACHLLWKYHNVCFLQQIPTQYKKVTNRKFEQNGNLSMNSNFLIIV